MLRSASEASCGKRPSLVQEQRKKESSPEIYFGDFNRQKRFAARRIHPQAGRMSALVILRFLHPRREPFGRSPELTSVFDFDLSALIED
jgi:hypothetical protein